ncbi:hypothetical protein A4S06_10370 [Erysipelotrichaceae bacterium MTC7]|nr:hypothetical protein A4S06_10370 [Erysipelotrichaceae bacterium MTC7]
MNIFKRYTSSLVFSSLLIPVLIILHWFGDVINQLFHTSFGTFFSSLLPAYLNYYPLLLAACFAYFFSNKKDATAVLSGIIAFIVLTNIASIELLNVALDGVLGSEFTSLNNINTPFIGILCGLFAAKINNRFSGITLPSGFAFFSGKRLVPILTGFFMIPISILIVIIWPVFYKGIIRITLLKDALHGLGYFFYKVIQLLGSLVGISFLPVLHNTSIMNSFELQIFRVVMPLVLLIIFLSFNEQNKKSYLVLFTLFILSSIITGTTLLFGFILFAMNPKYFFAHVFIYASFFSLHFYYQVELEVVIFTCFIVYTIVFTYLLFSKKVVNFLEEETKPKFSKTEIEMVMEMIGGYENVESIEKNNDEIFVNVVEEMYINIPDTFHSDKLAIKKINKTVAIDTPEADELHILIENALLDQKDLLIL